MKLKRFFIFSLILFLIAIIIFSTTLLFKNNSQNITKNIETTEKKELVPSKTTEVYKDDSGFTFNYPDDLTVVKKEASDSATYSNILISSKLSKGTINIVVADTKNKTISDWISKNISTQSAETTKDILLGDLSGKEIITSNQSILIAIDNGVLFRIDTSFKNDKKYWQESLNLILSSFSFVMPEPTVNINAAVSNEDSFSDDVILEEDSVE